MNQYFSCKTAQRLTIAAGALAVVAGLAGCGMGPQAVSGAEPFTVTAKMQGNVHGGRQGVVGSTIALYAVGTTGYGSVATSLLTSSVTTDRFGSFAITGTYTCPSANTLVYITATGGNPGLADGTNNAAIKLMSALGTCGSLTPTTFITINEVSTAAAAFAMGQYFTPTFGSASTDSFGSPNTTQAKVGIANAMATVNNLVTLGNGTAVQTATLTGAAGTITTTPEYQKLSTIADILASCVNSDGGSSSVCQTTLFPDVAPQGGTLPTDTLQAAVYLSLNPTSNNANGSAANIAALYALETPTSPYQPNGLTAAPADWTLGINYSAGASAANTLINGANGIAIDGGGNVWLINYNTAAATTESLTELSPTGTPLVNPFNGGGAASATSASSSSPRNLAIDSANNVFVSTTSGSSYVYEYTNAGVSTSLAIGSQPYVPIINGTDLYLGKNSGTTIGFDYFPGGSLVATNRIEFPYSATPLSQATYGAYATDGTLYLSLGAAATTVTAVTNRNSSACVAGAGPCLPANTSATYTAVGASGGINTPFGMAAAQNGAVWVANNASGANTVTYITSPTGTATAFGSAASFNAPRKIAVDGLNRAWVLNRGNAAVSEITTTGTILSPVPATGNTTPVGFVHAGAATVTDLAIDPSGNVWIANGTTSASTSDINSIFEIVGAAAPTTTPIAAAVANSIAGTTATQGGVGVRP